jgi:hypothetical protein
VVSECAPGGGTGSYPWEHSIQNRQLRFAAKKWM